ncbi:energy transducer TonB [Idiomarina abyssalis]|uniref:energy transducer TonB n=1 Tax=Idiomarina abyssalis TaxID=86102 RepID=UPI001C940F3A|nr:energy transducer TonB [Idiomarina abyssalis]QZN89965.1 energy transducer TonB [Idiomarina abyssalis]
MTKHFTVFSFILVISALLISGCKTTSTTVEYPNLPVVDNELGKSKWAQLERFPARYPQQAVINSTEGCATIEYVITPENNVRDIVVVKSTNKHFAATAQDVVTNWKWKDLSNNIISEPVKTQTRFDFCFDKAGQACSTMEPEYSCPGEDIIYSRGMMVQ